MRSWVRLVGRPLACRDDVADVLGLATFGANSVLGSDDFWALRRCLLAPLPEHAAAATLLSEAADALLYGKIELAGDLVRRADMPVLFDHTTLIMSGRDPQVQRRRPVAALANSVEKVASRMPSSASTNALFARDGWHCRFCGCPVVPPLARRAMRAALPGAISWSETEGFHGAFFALSASVDHVVPHSAGGTNEDANLVTACWSCQFGRGAWSLEEVGLLDPRAYAPVTDEWDGLSRLLRKADVKSTLPPIVRVAADEVSSDVRDVPLPAGQSSKLSKTEWFARLDAIQTTPSRRLLSFLETCGDLGVSWSLDKVLLIRMSALGRNLEIIGVLPDGTLEIPWSIGDAKDPFRGFAEMLAAALPGALYYETPRQWVVSWPGKKRLNLIEILGVLPALRLALERLSLDLLP